MHPMTPAEAAWFAAFSILRAHEVKTPTASREATRLVVGVEPNPVEFATPFCDQAAEALERSL